MSGPRGFIVVGETDYWDVSRKNVEVAVDARLRRMQSTFWTGGNDAVVGSKRVRAKAVPTYAEFLATAYTGASNGLSFGIVPTNVSNSDNHHIKPGSVYFIAGGINFDAANVESGLGAIVGGEKWGLEIYRDSSDDVWVQFYKQGVPIGSAHQIPDVEYLLSAQVSIDPRAWVMLVDSGEQTFRPSNSQPWGAAARVASFTGPSRSATRFDYNKDGNTTIDAFGRTAIYQGPNESNGSVLARYSSPDVSRLNQLVCDEFAAEDIGAGNVYIGLHPRYEPITYLGTHANSYAVSTGGTKRNNNINTVIGSFTVAVEDRYSTLWNPATGEIWLLRNGVPMEGDPAAGTGASFTAPVGLDLVPAVTLENGTQRYRLCTHAREQKFRPAYAVARDGADLLPELRFDDCIASVPRVKREVSYFPWARQRNRGETIGQLDLDNADGKYDRLSDWDLRNQPIVAYSQRADGTIEREWTGLIDSVEHPDEKTCRIEIADATAALDVHVPSAKLLLGSVGNFPLEPRQGSELIYEVAQTPWVLGTPLERGVSYSSGFTGWRFKSSSTACAIERTTAPLGYQGFIAYRSFYSVTQIPITNADLAAWSGGAPVGWTVHTRGAGSSVVQNGGAARIKAGSTGAAGISQTFAVQAGRFYGLKVSISQYHAGSSNAAPAVYITDWPPYVLSYGSWNGSATRLFAAKNSGEYWAPFFLAAEASWTSILVACFEGEEFSIDGVELHELGSLSTMEGTTRYLLQQLPEKPVPLVWTDCPGYPTGGSHGWWYSERPTIRQALARWLSAELADCYTDPEGTVQIAWLLPPEEFVGGPGYLGEITEDDLRGPLNVEVDTAPGLTDGWGYNENFSRLNDSDVAGSAPAALRAYLLTERHVARLAFSSPDADAAGPLGRFYAHAVNGPAHPGTRYSAGAVAATFTENDPDLAVPSNRWNSLIRQHRCYPAATQRRFFSMEIDREIAMARRLRPGGVITFTHSRYGLSGGKAMQVVSVESALTEPTVRIRCWG